MRKKAKFGINSGNSFAFGSNLTRLRHYGVLQQIVVKTLRNKHIQPKNHKQLNARVLQESSDIVNDGIYEGSNKHTILYSLNKRKRWYLKSTLLEAIDQLHKITNTTNFDSTITKHESNGLKRVENKFNNANAKFTISLTERKIKRIPCLYGYYSSGSSRIQDDCTSYHNSGKDVAHVYPRCRNVACETDLVERCSNKNIEQLRFAALEKKRKRQKNHNLHFQNGVQRKIARKKEVKTKKKQRPQSSDGVNDNAWIFRFQQPTQPRLHNHSSEADANTKLNVPEIHYEICSQHPAFNHKEFRDYSGLFILGYNKGFKAKKKLKGSRNKSSGVFNSYTVKELKNYCSIMSEDDDILEDIVEDTSNKERSPLKINVLDLIHNVQEKQKLKNLSKRQNDTPYHIFNGIATSAKYGKRECIYVNEEKINFDSDRGMELQQKRLRKNRNIVDKTIYQEAEASNEADDIILDTSFECATVSPIFVPITYKSITSKHLQSVFGDFFIDGHCSPCVFVINVSQHYKHKQLLNDDGGKSKENDIYLILKPKEDVFELALDKTIAGWQEMDEIVEVSITVDGNFDIFQQLGIQNTLSSYLEQFSKSTFTVEDIVDLLITSLLEKYNSFLHGKEFFLKPTYKSKFEEYKRSTLCQQLVDYNNWCISNYDNADAMAQMEHLSIPYSRPKLKKLHSTSCVQISKECEDVCDICFVTLDTDSGKRENCTALRACKHWFCNSCWRHHIIQAINNGALLIECPAYECDTVIDTGVLIALIPVKSYYKFWHHLQNHKLESYSDWKWCPNTKCSRAINVKILPMAKRRKLAEIEWKDPSGHFVCVQCTCSHKWCFDCQLDPHWPVSCAAAKRYIKIAESRDDEANQDKIFAVEVKKCPRCKHPINKNGGCQHMVCRCNFSFCWECLAPWVDHYPLLTCPRAAVKTYEYELENTAFLHIHQIMIKRAMDFRKLKKQYMKPAVAVIEQRIMNLQLNLNKFCKAGKSSLLKEMQEVRKKDRESLIASFQRYRCYIAMVSHVLEFSYGFLAQYRQISKATALINDLQNLEFAFSCLQSVLNHKLVNEIEEFVENFQRHQSKANTLIDRICRRINSFELKTATV